LKNFFRIIILIFSQANLTSAVKLKCLFTICDELYCCNVENNLIFRNATIQIDVIEGVHHTNKTDDDVKAINFFNIPKMTTIPSDITEFFENLVWLQISQTSMSKIQSSDLQPFSKLTHLNLYKNELEVVEKSLFMHNRDLVEINLSINKIRHIDPLAFSELRKLRSLFLSDNVCRFDNVNNNRQEVEKMVKKIENRECFSSDATNKDTTNDPSSNAVKFNDQNSSTQSSDDTTEMPDKPRDRKPMTLSLILPTVIVVIIFIVTIVIIVLGSQASDANEDDEHHREHVELGDIAEDNHEDDVEEIE
jgi:Leucine-rich repeat (LRR) protein